MAPRANDPSVGALLGSLVRETGSLVHQEMNLAKVEMAGKSRQAAKHGGVLLVGGAFAHAGLVGLGAALVLGLGSLLPFWLSALLMGVVLLGIGYGMARAGLSGLQGLDPVPTETVASVRRVLTARDEDPMNHSQVWAKENLK